MRFFSLTLSLLLFFTIHGQTFKVQYSEPVKELDRAFILPINQGGYIAIKKEDKGSVNGSWNTLRKQITLLLFDKNVNLVKERTLSKEEASVAMFYSEFIKIGDKYWLFYIENAEKNNIGDLKAIEVNETTLEVSAPKTLLSKEETRFVLTYKDGPSEFKVINQRSPDDKNVMVLLSFKEEVFILKLNHMLNPVWTRKEVIKDSKARHIHSIAVDNNGICYTGYSKKQKGYVLAVDSDGKTTQDLELNLNSQEPREVLLLAQKDNSSVAVVGTYFNSYENIAGVFKGSLRPHNVTSLEIIKTPFPEKLIEQFANDYWASTKDKKYGLEPNFLTHLFEVKDGIVDLVIEMKKSRDITRMEVNYTQNYTAVTSGNILNVYFGSTPTFSRLPKFNVADGGFWKHFYAIPYKENVVIFYNDNEENLERNIDLKPKQVNIERNSVLVAAIIDPSGTVKRVLPLPIKESYMGIAEWMQVVSTNNVLLPIHGLRKKKAYATITIEQ